MNQWILIVDLGGHNNQLIARRVREHHVYCELVQHARALKELETRRPNGIILSGGPASTFEKNAPAPDARLLSMGIPVLGIGYGAQWMAKELGGEVQPPPSSDAVDAIEITVMPGTLVGEAAGDGSAMCRMDCRDIIAKVPSGFTVSASDANGRCVAMENATRGLFATQFSLESDRVAFGRVLLHDFLFRVCGCTGDWTAADFAEQKIEELKAELTDKRVLCALSGGVDSSVSAMLVHRAIGDRLTCIFVDHGLMRKNEGDEVMAAYKEKFHLNVIRVNAGERFLGKLAGVTDPEQKRKIIGAEFIAVFDEEAAKLGQQDYLLQGTIYPDILESGQDGAAVVKSHHNVGGLPEDMKLKLCEPVRLLFKDEVRAVGRALGIPDEMVDRQPFPGPGLAVRCLGEVREDKLALIRESDAILREEFKNAGLHKSVWQYFALLPNLKSVGVTGDSRTYCHTIALRAIHTVDAMTADFARIPYEVLEKVSHRIVSEVAGVNRVVYDITAKPPATIEWE